MSHLENIAAQINSNYFLPEFTFSNTTFSPAGSTELELADGIVWLGDEAVVLQMKERNLTAPATSDSEARWFANKVVRDGTKQVRDTLSFLANNPVILARNQRGQQVELRGSSLKSVHKAVLYSEIAEFPGRKRFHHSSSAGFIHIMTLADYEGIVRTLCTPAELFEYLSWRERTLVQYSDTSNLPEQSILGNYLWGNAEVRPSIGDVRFLYALENDSDNWDMTGVLHKFLERSTEADIDGTKYHRILTQIAKLNRAGLRSFKERFLLSLEKAKKGDFTLPYRFTNISTGCGFVFIPLEEEVRPLRRNVLSNFTRAHMYLDHLDHGIGITFLRDPDGWFTIDWCYTFEPWEYDVEMEAALKRFLPFRETTEKRLDRYSFSRDVLLASDAEENI